MESELVKLKVLEFCKNSVNLKIDGLQESLKSLEESLMSETKSSAGDKHETGRAMIQLEREQLGRQLVELESQLEVLSRINISQRSKIVSLGSLVQTDALSYYISVGLGEIKQDGKTFYAVSINSPIGKVLKGKKQDEIVEFRGDKIEILKIS